MAENFISCGCAGKLITLYVDLEKAFQHVLRKRKGSARDWIIITRGAVSSVESACNVRLENVRKKLDEAYNKLIGEKWETSYLELVEAQNELDRMFKKRICPVI